MNKNDRESLLNKIAPQAERLRQIGFTKAEGTVFFRGGKVFPDMAECYCISSEEGGIYPAKKNRMDRALLSIFKSIAEHWPNGAAWRPPQAAWGQAEVHTDSGRALLFAHNEHQKDVERHRETHSIDECKEKLGKDIAESASDLAKRMRNGDVRLYTASFAMDDGEVRTTACRRLGGEPEIHWKSDDWEMRVEAEAVLKSLLALLPKKLRSEKEVVSRNVLSACRWIVRLRSNQDADPVSLEAIRYECHLKTTAKKELRMRLRHHENPFL